MNRCINEYNEYLNPIYRNRRYVASYSRRTRSTRAMRTPVELLRTLICMLATLFDNVLFRAVIKIATFTVAGLGFLFLVAAIDGGMLGLGGGIAISAAVMSSGALALLL